MGTHRRSSPLYAALAERVQALEAVLIEKGLVDKAALDILRRASPFDPFPMEVRADYDRLRFAYKWVFSEELENATAAAQN